MKLRALRLHGFKSFADRTEILFNDGITAIVGPNGCGKSNISDAIRWVLGEQRPTAIRGAKMEEVIFQGTVTRRGVSRGSVSMEVSNEDGALPVPFSEVEIARTVFRDGGSEYSLNRSACRLRDVQDLCRDTGLGANAYAVIENRMIDAILSERAEERRGMFEEAAGIGKYKDRRREASRRLERAEVDVQRLEDLIGEVQSKVRSLARQKGKAERYIQLRKQRLNLEVALARGHLEGLGQRLQAIRGTLSGDRERDEGLRARITTAESRLETMRVDQVARDKVRAAAGSKVDEVKGQLARWERELAVAEGGAGYADRRAQQIVDERAESKRSLEEADQRGEEFVRRREALDASLAELMEHIGLHEDSTSEARHTLAQAREGVSDLEGRERAVARRIAELSGDVDAGETRCAELEDRIGHLGNELKQVQEALSDAASQGDLFTDRLEGLSKGLELARSHLDEMRAKVGEARELLDGAREEEMNAQDRFGALSARRSALEQMERDGEGVGPAVHAVLEDPPAGVLGILADFVTTEPEFAQTIEAVLGGLLQAVVVQDTPVAMKLARWFHEEWDGGGGLVVLPLDRVPAGEDSGSLLAKVTIGGEGGPWARSLLGGFELDSEPISGVQEEEHTPRVSTDGSWVDRDGVFHLGNPLGSTGILERKEHLAVLEVEVGDASAQVQTAASAREAAGQRLARLDSEFDEARDALQAAEDAYREARSELAERSDRLLRMERLVRELEGQRSAASGARARAGDGVAGARRERESLAGEEEALRDQRGNAREALGAAQDRWEEIRGAEARLSIERTRLEGDIARVEERRRDTEGMRRATIARIEALEAEEERLSAEKVAASELLLRGKGEMERLFTALESAETEFRETDQSLSEMHEALAEAERSVRETRIAERAASDQRHGLELEEQEIRGQIGRIQDRLEGEWGRSLERLLEEADPIDAEESELRSALSEVVISLDRIGAVNMLAVEEHEEESDRLSFLSGQQADLVEARNDLRAAIREINETATKLFMFTFEEIRKNFRDTFVRLFEGGECNLWLQDPDDPLESAIEVHAAPRGKRTQRIDLLSGGERALTALSLLFGIYLVKPSPFCVLDEVDAPLDESNIGRFIRLLQEFKERSQFVVITHNPRTIEAAEWIYGVTMEEPGVSSIVGVRLDEMLETAAI